MNNQNTGNNAAIVEISLENLKIHPKNIRESYEGIEELAASIRENGILQNLTVVPDTENEGMYLVVIGNRRLTAAKEAGIATAPCRIASMEESEQVMSMLTENMNRKDLKIHEEAAGVQMCLTDYGFSVEDVAQKTGLSQTTVRHRANIAKLDKKALREKAEDGNFQLTITDLAKLEKVSSIAVRNRILREARDSRDLAWKAQSAADEEKRKKVTKKLTALAKKEGIEEAPEGTANELYGNKWETVAEHDLAGDIPETLYDGEKDGLFYVIHYRTFKIIRKAKKVKKELTEREVKEKEISKKKRQIKAMYKEMHTQMGDFVRSIIGGKTEELKEMEELVRGLWDLLMAESAWINRNHILCTLLGKDYYDAPEEERAAAQEKISALPLHHQMLAVAYWSCREVELCGYGGCYAENNAAVLKKLYFCLALYGFSFAEEESVSLMDGTHDLYVVKDGTESEEMAETENKGQPEADTEGKEEVAVAGKEERILNITMEQEDIAIPGAGADVLENSAV